MKILSIIAILFSFSQCGSTNFVKNPPFIIESATYTNWVGGVQGVSGRRVELKISEKENTIFDSLFFQKKVTKIEIRKTEEITFLTGHFSTSTIQNRDLILHSDSTKELKNKVPTIYNIPFDLKDNEAVISYKIDGKTKFFKVENIQKTASDLYPKVNK